MAGCDTAFNVDTSHVTFGAGCLTEVGDVARSLAITRVGLFTDDVLVSTPHVDKVRASLVGANIDVALYDNVRVESTDESFRAATRFAVDAGVDGFVSVGGGSTIDTAKAANLYATHPADFLAYVNAPIGRPFPSPDRCGPTSPAPPRPAPEANAPGSPCSTCCR